MPKETRKKRRKRKGGTSDLCKLFGDTNGIVSKAEADAYCAKFYLENGWAPPKDWDLAIGPHLRPANTCSAEGKCYREETEGERYRARMARREAETAAESGSTGSTGGRRKTRKKKRKTKRKKKRKTKRRRKKRNRKKK